MELNSIHELDWVDDAACIMAPNPDIFFPPRNKELYKPIADEAKEYCFGIEGVRPPCPVRKECLWSAVQSEEQHGIWGGLSHRERNALVRKWQRQYKDKMTLKEYIFQLNKKEKANAGIIK